MRYSGKPVPITPSTSASSDANASLTSADEEDVDERSHGSHQPAHGGRFEQSNTMHSGYQQMNGRDGYRPFSGRENTRGGRGGGRGSGIRHFDRQRQPPTPYHKSGVRSQPSELKSPGN